MLLGYIFPISCISLTWCVTGSRVSGKHSLNPNGITGPLGCDWCRKGKYDLHDWASGLSHFSDPSIQLFLIPITYLSFRYCNGFHLHWWFLCGKTGGKGLKMPSSSLELWREVVISFNSPLSYLIYSGSHPLPFFLGYAMVFSFTEDSCVEHTTGGKGLKMSSSTLELWREVVLSFN